MEKFYNREKEIEMLKKLSYNDKFRVSIIGKRRIGKTTLVKKAFPNAISLFVPENKSEKMIIKEWKEEYDFIPETSTFRDVFTYLFKYFPQHIYFIDEFQNIVKINKSILSDMQYLIDKYNPSLIITGSLISMMKYIVEDYKSPLYGRFDYILKLDELSPLTCFKWGLDLNLDLENIIELWSVIGGIPKYWNLYEKISMGVKEFIKSHFLLYPQPLYKEIEVMLKEEFGKEHKIYFSILEAISQGRNRIGEISNYVGITPTNLTKYIYTLHKEHEIIKKVVPFGSKRGIYDFKSNIFSFWFTYPYKHIHLIENESYEILNSLFDKTFNAYVGRKFETFSLSYLRNNLHGFSFYRWWHKDKEIDVIAINEQTKELLAVEVKWQDIKLRDAKKIIEELHEKIPYVKWHNEERKEVLGIFAKSMDKKARDWLESNGYKGWDLKDVEKCMR